VVVIGRKEGLWGAGEVSEDARIGIVGALPSGLTDSGQMILIDGALNPTLTWIWGVFTIEAYERRRDYLTTS
jgi:hypothetical protein